MVLQNKIKQPDILFVVNDFNFLRSHRLELLKYLSSKGFKVSVATNLAECSEQALNSMKLYLENIEDYRDDRASINPLKSFFSLFKLYLILRRIKPKILSLVSPKPIILGGIASFLLQPAKIFFTISGMGYVFIDKSLKARILQKVVFGLYKILFQIENSGVIFQNSDDRNLFIEKGLVNDHKTHVIKGNGINTDCFYRKEPLPHKLTFLFASRLLKDKGINEFIKAAENICNQNVVFRVAGGIDESNPNSLTLSELELLKLNKDIDYVGRIEYQDMPKLFTSAHIFVLPSYREGLPQVALEAASFSMPLLLTDVNGCRDCILERENGFLVKPKDWKDLSDKFYYFINHPEEVAIMGEKSRKYILNNFSEDIIHGKFLELYSK